VLLLGLHVPPGLREAIDQAIAALRLQ